VDNLGGGDGGFVEKTPKKQNSENTVCLSWLKLCSNNTLIITYCNYNIVGVCGKLVPD
jgi:hypothetical protein